MRVLSGGACDKDTSMLVSVPGPLFWETLL